MASVLQRQLAEIAAKSTHQLDLKAQKAQHSRSLLFEPGDASHQSFDDIFQICIEGFEDLCQLDSRFLGFANNLFSDGSKSVDRSELTGTENEELDSIIQRFLGLLQARLLLKPAQKSMEWLVRRWRVHEFNIEALLLAFLPYHNEAQLFPALLTLLPANRQLPESFKWLHPYIAPRSCPPSHAVLAAATSNRSFFTAFNTHTLAVAKAGHTSSVQLAFWTRLTLQAVNNMLDASQSGRDEVRKQKQDDLLVRILPMLGDAFHISKNHEYDELYVGSCMVVVVLATKVELADATLDALMETVADTWTQRTVSAALSCLSILMEERSEITIPKSASNSIFQADIIPTMVAMSRSQRMSKLAAALSKRLVQFGFKNGNAEEIKKFRHILEANIIQQEHLRDVISSLFRLIKKDQHDNVSRDMLETLTVLASIEGAPALLEEGALDADISPHVLQAIPNFPASGTPEPLELENGDVDMDGIMAVVKDETEAQLTDATKFITDLPQLPDELYSFIDLRRNDSALFEAFTDGFVRAMASDNTLTLFLSRFPLHGDSPLSSHALMTFLARLWATGSPQVDVRTKTQALQVASREAESYLAFDETKKAESGKKRADMQLFFPYILTALADSNPSIRKAAAQLYRSIDKISGHSKGSGSEHWIWGKETISESPDAEIPWLSSAESSRFLHDCLLPVLEDCVLDSNYIGLVAAEILNSSTRDGSHGGKELKKEQRTSVCNFLAWQAIATPVLRTRLALLRILSRTRKAAAHARVRYLLPFLQEWSSKSVEGLTTSLDAEGIDLHDVDRALLENMWQPSEGMHEKAREICIQSPRKGFLEATFEQQRKAWPQLKSNAAKLDVLQWLLKLGLGQLPSADGVSDLAVETLRTLDIPPEVLVAEMDDLPSLGNLQGQPPARKKRRQSAEADQSRAVSQETIRATTRKVILVLELLEASKPQAAELLRPLFHLLNELRLWKSVTGSDLTYLYTMLLDSLLSIVRKAHQTGEIADLVDKNIIRTDLLIECVRDSSSPQIHNTALLLISSLAALMPENVMHSVMPLFTFMSTTLLQRTDDYSAHITEHTIAHIVPALASSMKSKGRNVLIGVSEMLLSFVAAWEHIPLHRRLETFEMVVDAVGVNECLGAISATLAERYLATDKTASAFLVDMIRRHGAVEILQAADQWLSLVESALQPSKPQKQKDVSVSEVLFAMSEKDEEERVETVKTLLNGLAALLHEGATKSALVASLTKSDADGLQHIHTAYSTLLEHTVRLTQNFSTATLTVTGAAGLVLSAVLSLLPTTDFIASSAEMMQTGSDLSRQMVFRSLESRVYHCRSSNVAESQTFINLLPSCAAFIRPDQSAEVVAAAIGCVDAICEKFGKSNPSLVLGAAERVAGEAALGSQDEKLRTLSLLCLASVAGVFEYGDESLSLFPNVLRSTLDSLTASTASPTTDTNSETEASFRLLSALLDHLPELLTTNPEELDRALLVATKARRMNQTDAAVGFMSLAAKKTAASDLFSSIERVWTGGVQKIEHDGKTFEESNFQTLETLIHVLEVAVLANTKATITKNAPVIFRLLLEGFDLRRRINMVVSKGSLPKRNEVFAAVGELALDVTLKMNDATFRPFFIRLVEWATSSLPTSDVRGKEQRLLGLYHFVFLLFERLGSLVTGYMSFLLESCADVVRQAKSQSTGSDLLRAVFKVLDVSFRNDEDDFWIGPAHFEAIAGPLIGRLGAATTSASSENELAVEAISNLATAVSASPDQLKFINNNLLALLRHVNANVRLIALQCQRTITRKVNFDWLALLPEMLPVISELQEDDDGRVEHETLVWVKEIEEISGESLEAMLA